MVPGACFLAAYDAPAVRVRKALDEKEMLPPRDGQVRRAQGCAGAATGQGRGRSRPFMSFRGPLPRIHALRGISTSLYGTLVLPARCKCCAQVIAMDGGRYDSRDGGGRAASGTAADDNAGTIAGMRRKAAAALDGGGSNQGNQPVEDFFCACQPTCGCTLSSLRMISIMRKCETLP